MVLPVLYVISDRKLCPGFIEVFSAIAEVAPVGSVAFQLREKDLSSGELYALTSELVGLLRGRALLFVNDRADVALAAKADGVHLSGRSMLAKDAKRLGLLVAASTHNRDEIEQAEGADFCTFGPVYDTPSKRAYGAPVGIESLAMCASGTMPLFALGGVVHHKIKELRACGARGVAVIGAVLASKDPVQSALQMIDAVIQ